MTTPAEIRSLYVETLARARYEQFAAAGEASGFPDYPWSGLPDNRRGAWIETAGPIVDALAAAGLLPTGVDYRWVYEPDGALWYRERQLVTDWRDAAVACSSCGVVERACGRWRGGTRCCPECRHPTRVVSE